MTDLHFDVKSMDWHFERNKWSITLTVYIGKGGEREEPFTEEDVHYGYDFAFIPLTLTRCLVVTGAGIYKISVPPHYLDRDSDMIKYQDIWLSGMEFNLISMIEYHERRKRMEKLAERRDNEGSS